jgi:SAM-dependent methyltransferase
MDAEFLARAGAEVVTSDVSLGAARRAQLRARRHGVEYLSIVADVEHLPFADDAFDIVYVHDGLHHLDDPLVGLAEMARVARSWVCVTEPAVAAVTSAAVRVGLALEQEDAGNRVGRLTASEIGAVLDAKGFRVWRTRRYAMLYRHEPGLPVRLFSLPGLFTIARLGMTVIDSLIGRFGNKLVVIGCRT